MATNIDKAVGKRGCLGAVGWSVTWGSHCGNECECLQQQQPQNANANKELPYALALSVLSTRQKDSVFFHGWIVCPCLLLLQGQSEESSISLDVQKQMIG